MSGASILSGTASGGATFVAYVALVLLGLRMLRGVPPTLLVLALPFAVCMAALAWMAIGTTPVNLWAFLVTYWFAVTCFLMAFGAVYKSLSLRMLSDLLSRPGHRDSYDAIFTRYLVADSFQNRLALIRDKGWMALDGDRYTLTSQGRAFATRVRAVQRFFGITRSG